MKMSRKKILAFVSPFSFGLSSITSLISSVALIPELPNTIINGATFWISNTKAAL
jgi:hypothetical protein